VSGFTVSVGSRSAVLDEVKIVLRDELELGDRADGFDRSTPLFESLVEFDSMAVVQVVTALEDRFGFIIEDHEIDGEIFETVGSLTTFVESKLQR
jgi:acyl carrier protein